jgi:hypothetical protein
MDGTYRLKFGRHKGEKLEDLPEDYLEWLAENLDVEKYNNAAVIEECQKQLLLKQGQGVSRKTGLIFRVGPKKGEEDA